MLTLRAMALLTWARLMVQTVSFERWRGTLGWRAIDARPAGQLLADARRLASQVERAAIRLPFPTKCLPRAMALSWLLRRYQLPHAVVIAVRPAELRADNHVLHAWVEVVGDRILGDLPGPWLETLRVGSPAGA